MKELKKILVSGGGTGGHIMPAIALCEEVRERFPEAEIHFAGRGDSMEERLAKKHGLTFHRVPSSPKGRGLRIIRNFFVNIAGFFKSLALIMKLKPQAVAAFGGYTSAPLLTAAKLLGKNAVIHESNAIPGRVTRLLAKFGVRVACGLDSDHPVMLKLKKGIKKETSFAITGNPLRKAFSEPANDLSKELPGYDESKPLLLVFGGSQGAHNINMLLARSLSKLKDSCPSLQVAHLCGENDIGTLKPAYENVKLTYWLFPFFDDIASLMKKSDLCVARSGALSVTEICASKLPAVLIPLPFAADNHQLANARVLEKAGAAIIREEKDLTASNLSETIFTLLNDENRRSSMAEAGEKVFIKDAPFELLKFIMAV
ncbi:undecaprenyldiphospho-muramoylpentapeptide beta-N-acetylglucosaminyltransferase [bacterium]|nr:undecaprenyldiphospho-muramoylpentapeptide beta-N-acetylglucosaminyltransferase [bacterium]